MILNRSKYWPPGSKGAAVALSVANKCQKIAQAKIIHLGGMVLMLAHVLTGRNACQGQLAGIGGHFPLSSAGQLPCGGVWEEPLQFGGTFAIALRIL